jgi:hypothetical protein
VTTGERVSTLEHLDALDQLLRDVQAELVPGAEIPDPAPPPPIPEPPPAPPVPEPPPVPGPAIESSRPTDPLPGLVAALLASMRELLAGYEHVLTPSPAPATRPAAARQPPPHATISAGPFASIEAVRSFETAVSNLPGVRDVAMRAYEGTDRALIDVRLDAAST